MFNPVIGGWCRYYNSVSSKIFKSFDNIMFNNFEMADRHNNKGKFWIKDKYFKRYKNDNWRFMSNNGMYLINHGDHAIKSGTSKFCKTSRHMM
ncbi:group II intron maturase-specific domain-containing protein [Wolbachia endosymbiont of Tribolium confusum]|uniref:group II intron maturase-specific domain-containing protein n=1 Tax=Wolbachia endosymbiont of Tribolium confusum TaxID=214474 RepID=UPI001CF43B47|nr:hypothetical protein [Wolbachia endosymbiont of Tribolium confusum]